MKDNKVIEIITDRKDRGNYEEKKALKLVFNLLYEYFKDKIDKEKLLEEEKTKDFKKLTMQRELLENIKKEQN